MLAIQIYRDLVADLVSAYKQQMIENQGDVQALLEKCFTHNSAAIKIKAVHVVTEMVTEYESYPKISCFCFCDDFLY